MARQCRNRYDDNFKRHAVLQHLQSHDTLTNSARQFGIAACMLSRWVKTYSPEQNNQAMNCEAEIKQLKVEMIALKEIVTKAFLQKYTDHRIFEKMIDEPEKLLKEDPFLSKIKTD
jgi:transposase-like protein